MKFFRKIIFRYKLENKMRKECKEKGFIMGSCWYDDEDGKRVSFSYTCEESLIKARIQDLYLKIHELLAKIILMIRKQKGEQ